MTGGPGQSPPTLLDQTGPPATSNGDGPEKQPLKTEFVVEDQGVVAGRKQGVNTVINT